jgi:hypothetical protein
MMTKTWNDENVVYEVMQMGFVVGRYETIEEAVDAAMDADPDDLAGDGGCTTYRDSPLRGETYQEILEVERRAAGLRRLADQSLTSADQSPRSGG